jgi:LysM repeat protein
MAEPTPPAGTNTSGFHRVRRGETLSEIADEYGVRQRDLRSWNGLNREGRIRAGQRLRVAPPGRRPVLPKAAVPTGESGKTHLVRRGETLTGLAKRYGVSVEALRTANGMVAGQPLRAGSAIKIPG